MPNTVGGTQKYKLRRLGVTNQIVVNLDSDNVEIGCYLSSDSKSEDKIRIRFKFKLD